MSDSTEIKSTQLRAILLACALGLLLLVLFKRLFGGQKGNVTLLLGPSGSGKTTLFHQLRDGSIHHGTVPSMQQNEDTVQLCFNKEKTTLKEVELVDIPGHPKVRGQAVTFYNRAKKILFLVDAVDFMGQKVDVAEQLYEVLSNPIIQKRRVPILIVCNKSDQGVKAHTCEFLRKRLEKELEALRSTRATLGEGGAQAASLGKGGEAFSFSALRSPRVSIASGSALTGELNDVKFFLK